MKSLITFSLCLFLSALTFSQTPEQMKAWQDNMTPGKYHQWLASMDGVWDATVSMWMDPSQPPDVSKAVTTNEMIMNGLYQRSQHKGNMMGQPFMGESITGYDNAQGKFLATWIDNFGSSIMYMEGQFDEASNTLTLEGSMMDPATGQNMKVKEVMTKTSDDAYKFVMYMVVGDQDIKNMEISYTRRE